MEWKLRDHRPSCQAELNRLVLLTFARCDRFTAREDGRADNVSFDVMPRTRPGLEIEGADEFGAPKALKIMESAKDLFMAEGYGAVSMDAVAKAAGVSKATVYSHFGSKEKLFAAIIHDACRGFAVDLFPQVEGEPDIGVALRRLASS